eukprot:6203165-Alexandrium_andersonii.AAC.1
MPSSRAATPSSAAASSPRPASAGRARASGSQGPAWLDCSRRASGLASRVVASARSAIRSSG